MDHRKIPKSFIMKCNLFNACLDALKEKKKDKERKKRKGMNRMGNYS